MLLCLRIRTWTPGQKCTSVNARSRNRGQCRADAEYGNPPAIPATTQGSQGPLSSRHWQGPPRLQVPWSKMRPSHGKHALAATAMHGQSRGGRGSRGWPCPDPVWCRAGTGVRGQAAHTRSSLPRLERELREACVRRSPGLVTGGMWPGQSLLTVPLNTTPFRFAERGRGEPGVVPGRRSQPEAGGDTREPWLLAPGRA